MLSGYQVRVVGLAPAAARLGGFSEKRTVLMTMLVGGALAGLAGMIECSASFGQLTPQFPVNYGFTAIIVAFLGRLHPIGVLIGLGARDLIYRRGYRPDGLRPAPGRDRAYSSDDAVLPARRRHIRHQPGASRARARAAHLMSLDIAISIVMTLVIAATPILLAGLGELVAEKSGVLNLGVEGMMLVGAVAGFIAASASGFTPLGYAVAALAGLGASLLFAVLALTLGANQVATGLALTIFGTGLSSLAGAGFVGTTITRLPALFPPDSRTIRCCVSPSVTTSSFICRSR